MQGKCLYATLALLVTVLAVGAWFFSSTGTSMANAALAEYQIEKMTCGSCVGNIQSVLAELDGIGSVDINLTSHRGRVIYDPALTDSRVIGEQITAAGYPARLRLELDPQEYAALQQEQAELGLAYIARIGDRLLARKEFEQIVQQRAGDHLTPEQRGPVWQSVWLEVLQRELLLAAAEQNKVVVQDGEVDAKLDALRKEHQGLDQMIANRYGGIDPFRKRLHEDMIIQRNIEDYVYVGDKDPRVQQDQLKAWYADLQQSTEVIIFDPQLNAAGQTGGGCACCNS